MNWASPEYKRVRITSIRCDVADIRRRMKEPHVKELAADIKARGESPIHAPAIRADSNGLLAGRDRMAALMVNKAKSIWVHRAECTDQEARALELAENIYRRADNRSELLAELQRITEQRISAEQDDARARGEAVPAGNTNSPAAQARREVARAAGVRPASVKRAEIRVTQRAASVTVSPMPDSASEPEEEANAGGAIELPPKFQTFGLDVPFASRAAIATAVNELGDWANDFNALLRRLTEIEKQGGYAVAPAHLQRIRERFEQAGHAVRDAVPTSLCFYCKAQPASTPTCPACGQTGVVGRHGGDNVPPELKQGGAAARVAVNGKFVLVGGAANAVAASATSKPVKTIRVVMDGVEIPLPDGDDELAF